jgi:hypothetical protein
MIHLIDDVSRKLRLRDAERLCQHIGGLSPEFVRHRSRPDACVLLLEDNTGRTSEMRRVLRCALPGADVKVFLDSRSVVRWLERHQAEVDLICLDHDLNDPADATGTTRDAGTGRDVTLQDGRFGEFIRLTI